MTASNSSDPHRDNNVRQAVVKEATSRTSSSIAMAVALACSHGNLRHAAINIGKNVFLYRFERREHQQWLRELL